MTLGKKVMFHFGTLNQLFMFYLLASLCFLQLQPGNGSFPVLLGEQMILITTLH